MFTRDSKLVETVRASSLGQLRASFQDDLATMVSCYSAISFLPRK